MALVMPQDEFELVKQVAAHLGRPWRNGRHPGRAVYALLGDEPSDSDPYLGIFDSAEIAAAVVAEHNAAAAWKQAWADPPWPPVAQQAMAALGDSLAGQAEACSPWPQED